MTNKLNKIFGQSDCVSINKLRKYINGKLSSSENHAIEKHISDCSMCSDIYHGLLIIPDKTNLELNVNDINKKIDSRNKKVSKIRNLKTIRYKFAIAVSILLIISSTIWLYNYTNNETTYTSESLEIVSDDFELKREASDKDIINVNENKKIKRDENTFIIKDKRKEKTIDNTKTNKDEDIKINKEKDIKTDDEDENYINEGEKNISVKKQNLKIEKNVEKKESKQEETIEIFDEEEISEKDEDILDDMVYNEKNKLKRRDKQAKRFKSDNVNALAGVESINSRYIKRRAKSNTWESINDKVVVDKIQIDSFIDINNKLLFNTAIDNYNNGKYSKAIILFEKILNIEPNNYQANYFCANSYYGINEYGKAIKRYYKIIKQGKGEFYESAQWYRAKCYKKLGKKRVAKKLFNKIINANSSYKNKAKDEIIEK